MCYIVPLLYTTKRCDIATCYIARVWYSTPPIKYKTVRYCNMLDICHVICQAMKAGEEKLCKSGCICRPRPWWWLGGRQRNASAADSMRWPDSGAPRSSSLNQPLLVACGGPARGWTCRGHSRVASRLSGASFRLWQDGRQP